MFTNKNMKFLDLSGRCTMIDYKKTRQNHEWDYKDHAAVLSSPTFNEIETQLSQGKCIIFDSEQGHKMAAFEKIKNAPDAFDLIICLKNINFYKLDFISILEKYLARTITHSLLAEQIITASHEAFSNAFMWSSLDLASYKEIRPYEFFQQIDDRLKDSLYRDRLMLIYLTHSSSHIEVSIFTQGHPIVWPEIESSNQFRGISIIKTFCNRVSIEEDGKGIRLFFTV